MSHFDRSPPPRSSVDDVTRTRADREKLRGGEVFGSEAKARLLPHAQMEMANRIKNSPLRTEG